MFIAWLLFLFYLPSNAQNLHITVHGGAEMVSGSMTELVIGSKHYLIDVGAFYPDIADPKLPLAKRQEAAEKANQKLPFEAKEIAAVFITHAHIDHAGRLPLLVKQGFNGPIFGSHGTKDILEEMLTSQVRYDNELRTWLYSVKNATDQKKSYFTAHWTSCEWAQKISPKNRVQQQSRRTDIESRTGKKISPCKVCAASVVREILANYKPKCKNEPFTVSPGFQVTLLDAGHIPGSVSILAEISLNGKTKRLLFSGDLGNDLSPLLTGPKSIPPVDAVWVETTYGGSSRETNVASEALKFQKDIAAAIQKGSIVWIPAFALDRTQKVLYQIKKAQERGLLSPNISVYCPSPTANAINRKYQNEITDTDCDRWFRSEIYAKNQTLFPVYENSLPQKLYSGSIVITTSGMMDDVFSESLLPVLVPNAKISIFLVGYADPQSPSGQLKAGKTSIDWEGQQIEVNAELKKYNSFSAHADDADVLKWLGNGNKKAKIFLVHGDKSALENRKKSFSAQGWNVEIAKSGHQYSF